MATLWKYSLALAGVCTRQTVQRKSRQGIKFGDPRTMLMSTGINHMLVPIMDIGFVCPQLLYKTKLVHLCEDH